MQRDVETESWNLDCGTANRKGRQQLRGTYRHRATSRLYRESRGRAAVRSVANLFADANVPLSERQTQQLVGVYTNAYETQGGQVPLPEAKESNDDGSNSTI